MLPWDTEFSVADVCSVYHMKRLQFQKPVPWKFILWLCCLVCHDCWLIILPLLVWNIFFNALNDKLSINVISQLSNSMLHRMLPFYWCEKKWCFLGQLLMWACVKKAWILHFAFSFRSVRQGSPGRGKEPGCSCWATSTTTPIPRLNSRHKSKQSYWGSWLLSRGEGTNVPLPHSL